MDHHSISVCREAKASYRKNACFLRPSAPYSALGSVWRRIFLGISTARAGKSLVAVSTTKPSNGGGGFDIRGNQLLKPRSRRCSSQENGKALIRLSLCALNSSGCRPDKMDSIMSGAKNASGRV